MYPTLCLHCLPQHLLLHGLFLCSGSELVMGGEAEKAGALSSVIARSRCLLGEADGALYMAFMGTKQRRDLVTNAQVLQEPIWPEDLSSDQQDASQVALHTALRPLIAVTV